MSGRRNDPRHDLDDRLVVRTLPVKARATVTDPQRRPHLVASEARSRNERPISAPTRVARVATISPCPLLRAGLRHVLSVRNDMVVVGESATLREGVRSLIDLRPDVLVVDLTRETDRPVELSVLSDLVRRHQNTRFLALATSAVRPDFPQLLTLGVAGIVKRDGDPAVIVAAIAALGALRGSHDIKSRPGVEGPSRPLRRADHGQLTNREFEVLQLLAIGLTNKEIGDQLYISKTTVKFHVSGVMRKFGVHSRVEGVYRAAQQGLV